MHDLSLTDCNFPMVIVGLSITYVLFLMQFMAEFDPWVLSRVGTKRRAGLFLCLVELQVSQAHAYAWSQQL